VACGWGGSGVCGPWLGDLLWGMLCWCWDGHVLILVHLQIDPSGWKAGLHLRCGSPSLCDSTVSHTEDQPGCSYKGKLNWRRVQEGKGSSPRQLDVARGQNDRWQKCCHSDLVTHVLEQNIIPVSQCMGFAVTAAPLRQFCWQHLFVIFPDPRKAFITVHHAWW